MIPAALKLGRSAASRGLWILAAALGLFLLLRTLPGDPAEIRLRALGAADAASVEAMRFAWGLDRPLGRQFLDWLGAIVRGDWGRSYATDRPVLDEIAQRLPWSAAIGLGGLSVAAILGFGLGFASALRPAGLADRGSRCLVVVTQALPAFGVGLALIWVLGAELKLIRPFSGGPGERLVLPILVVALFSLGAFARLSTSAFADAQAQPWMLAARAKGLTPRQALWRHGRRYALVALLAGLTPELGWAIGGTTITELVFAVPGLSALVVEAIAARDYVTLQAYLICVVVWMLAVHAVVSLLRRRLDPRPAGLTL